MDNAPVDNNTFYLEVTSIWYFWAIITNEVKRGKCESKLGLVTRITEVCPSRVCSAFCKNVAYSNQCSNTKDCT